MSVQDFRNTAFNTLNENCLQTRNFTIWCVDEKWSVCSITNPIVIQIDATINVNNVPIKVEFTFGKALVYYSNGTSIIVNTVNQFIVAVWSIYEKKQTHYK